MPLMLPTDQMEQGLVPTGKGTAFQFSYVRPEHLEETMYTLVALLIDTSYSVSDFSNELLICLKEVVKACKKHDRAEFVLLRLVLFNRDLHEVHGFVPLNSINPDDYDPLTCEGSTSLFDVAFSGIGATIDYAKKLDEEDFDTNAIVFLITDGEDTSSRQVNPSDIKKLTERTKKNEQLESLQTVLVGVNTVEPEIKTYLDNFKDEAGFDQYIDIGKATAQKLAKLVQFVSTSISSTSQALNTGSSSKPISMSF